MSDELDPTTARLVSELAASILPSLTQSLNSAIPANDFSGALERISRTSQDLRTHIDKAVRSSIDENRAARSMMMQSLGNLLEEISALKRSVDRLPENIRQRTEKTEKAEKKTETPDNTQQKLDEITGLLTELIQGLQNFAEAKPHVNAEMPESSQVIYESDRRLDKMMTTTLPALEGLVKAEGKAHTHELEEFSKEISALHEQNNIALLHEVKEAVKQELKAYGDEMLNQIDAERTRQTEQVNKMFRVVIIASGINIFLFLATVIFSYFL